MTLIIVKAAYDPDAKVWYVEHSDLYGLNAEAATIEGLVDKLPALVADLLEESGQHDIEVPIELVAHARTRAKVRAAA